MSLTTNQHIPCLREPVPVFVQPQLVLFPGTSQLISLCGSSLRQMVTEALDTSGLMAVAHPSPAVQQTDVDAGDFVILAEIITPTFLTADARHLHLRGICRARIVSGQANVEPYRRAVLELCPDHYPATPVIDRRHRREELLILFRGLFSHVARNDLFQLWQDADIPLGDLCDTIADLLPVERRRKQPLLSELNVDLRSDLLLDQLRTLSRTSHITPQSVVPAFSLN